jgi:hypothetical protein
MSQESGLVRIIDVEEDKWVGNVIVSLMYKLKIIWYPKLKSTS